MSDDLEVLEGMQSQRLIKIAMMLYAIIFALIAVDILGDYGDGIEWSHIVIEVLVLIMAMIGLGLFGRYYHQAAQGALLTLQTDLAVAQQEAVRWREESRELIAGLASEIQKQFARWQLTNAEAEVGMLLMKGLSHQEIANVRMASERTVREQARSLYRKAGLSGRSSLSAFFLEDLLLPKV